MPAPGHAQRCLRPDWLAAPLDRVASYMSIDAPLSIATQLSASACAACIYAVSDSARLMTLTRCALARSSKSSRKCLAFRGPGARLQRAANVRFGDYPQFMLQGDTRLAS